MRTVSSLAALTLVMGVFAGTAYAADAPKKTDKTDKVDEASKPSAPAVAHKKHASKAHKAAAVDKGDKDGAKKPEKPSTKAHASKDAKPSKDGVVLASAKVSTSDKKHGEAKLDIVLASAKTPAHASKVDRHADAKSRAKGGSHAEIRVQHQVRDTLGRHHADTHGEPSKQDLERLASDTHRAEEQKLLSKVRFNKENGVEIKRASTKADKGETLKGKQKAAPTCNKPAVDFIRGDHTESIRLVTCDGNVLPEAVKSLTEMVKPPVGMQQGSHVEHKNIEPRLIGRLETIAEHFGKSHPSKGAGKASKVSLEPARIEIVSGYRPYSKGSYHAHARAVDIRVKGVSNEELLAFCKTLEDTGCGYYPNSTFVHVDARDVGAGHVSWIDASGPGETPRYVSAWPPPSDEADVKDVKTDAVAEADKSSSGSSSSSKTDKKAETPREEPLPAPGADKADKSDKAEKSDKSDG